jgi:ACS family glucarate transporter-like MFS transporter
MLTGCSLERFRSTQYPFVMVPSPLPDTRSSRIRYHVLLWLCVVTAIAYIDRGCLSVAEGEVRTTLDLDAPAMGWLMGAFFVAYAVFQLPAGGWAHRLGGRRALPLFSASWSAATALTAVAGGFWGMAIGRIGLGAAEAGVFPGAVEVLGQWFPPNRRGWASGIMTACMGLGGALGAILTGFGLVHLGWRGVFGLYAVPGFVWAIGFYVWFRNRPEDHPAVSAAELALIRDGEPARDKVEVRESTPWGIVLTNSAVWWLSGQQFFRAAAFVFYLSWFPTYLRETRGVSLEEAGALTSLPHLAALLGALIGGGLSDTLLPRVGGRWARAGVGTASMIGAVLLLLLAYPIANPTLMVLVLSAGALSASLAGPCAYAAIIDTAGPLVAPAFSLMNLAGNIGAVLFPIVAPRLVALTGSWDAALLGCAALHGAAMVCWAFVNPDEAAPAMASMKSRPKC